MPDSKDDLPPPATAKPQNQAKNRLGGAAPEPEAQDNTAKGRKGG